MRPRLSPLPPDLALSLSPSSTRALLSRFAPDFPPFAVDDPFAVAEALCYRLVPAPLADVFAPLTRLADTVGREALLELLAFPSSLPATTIAAPTPLSSRDFRPLSPVNLAARVLCARGLPPRRARDITRRALLRVARSLSPRPWYTLVAARADLPARPESLVEAGRVVYGADFVRGWVASCIDGVLRVIVVYRGPGESIVNEVAGVARARTVRPYACDVVRWDSRDGRVSFALARPAVLSDWVSAIAQSLATGLSPSSSSASSTGSSAAESHVFSDRLAYTLKSLHEKGDTWLASLVWPAGVAKVAVVMCEVDEGKRVRVRSDSALADVHEKGARGRGYVLRATLRITLMGHDEPVDVTIDVPWKIYLSDPRFEEDVRLVMETLEAHAAGSLADDVPSVAPMQPEWRWVDLLGPDGFARAVEMRILVRVRGKRPGGREHRRWGSLLRAFDVSGDDAAHVVGEELAIRAFDAKPEALVWYAIDWTRTADVLRAGMGLEATRVTNVPDGVLPIGEMGGAGRRVVVFSVVRGVGEGEVMEILRQLRLACGRATPALIVAKGRSLGGAVAEVEVTPREHLGVEDLASVATRIAEECGLGDEDIEPGKFATDEAPLVLSVARGEAWYGNVRLLVTENQLAMFFALARAKGWMTSTELGRKILPSADHPDQIVRKARLTLAEKIAASFAKAGVEMPKGLGETLVLVDRSRGYRLGVGVIVR